MIDRQFPARIAAMCVFGIGVAFTLNVLHGQTALGKADGVVINAATHTPVKKAVVFLGAVTAVTDAAGRFHFDDVSNAKTALRAVADGFVNSWKDLSQVRVRDAQHVTIGPLELEPYRKIVGRVLDAGGSPLDGYEVKAINSDEQRPTMSARTNDLGEFRLVDLPVGRYFLQVSPLSGNLEPQTTDPIDMRNIVQQEGVDIRVPRAGSAPIARGGAAVTGRVVDSDGDPVRDANVVLSREHFVLAGASDDRGEFRLAHLAPGNYALRVTPPKADDAPWGEALLRAHGLLIEQTKSVSVGAGGEMTIGDLDLSVEHR
jgi:protocatechuate 3,4-dioxygenase beta subunit